MSHRNRIDSRTVLTVCQLLELRFSGGRILGLRRSRRRRTPFCAGERPARSVAPSPPTADRPTTYGCDEESSLPSQASAGSSRRKGAGQLVSSICLSHQPAPLSNSVAWTVGILTRQSPCVKRFSRVSVRRRLLRSPAPQRNDVLATVSTE